MCHGCMPACYLSLNLVALTRLPKHNYFAISFKPPPSFPLSFISTCELRNFEGFLFVSCRLPGVAIHRQDNIFRWMESPGSWMLPAPRPLKSSELSHWGHPLGPPGFHFKLQMIAASTLFLWHQKKARELHGASMMWRNTQTERLREPSNWPNSWTSSSHRMP